MKKSITKSKGRKRAKSIMAKAWETRRAKVTAAQEAVNQLRSRSLDSLAKVTQTSETETQSSEAERIINDANETIAVVLARHRDEMLLGFMGDMLAMRSTNNINGHHPIMVSRAQVIAIEQFLNEHGYSAWGKENMTTTAPATAV